MNEIKDILMSWADGSYDPEDIKKLKKIEIPIEYRKTPEEIYRGERFDSLAIKDLERKKSRAYGLSWTTDKKTAESFAKQNDTGYGIVWKYKPKTEEILLDVDLFAKKYNIKFPYDEKEILLKDNVMLTINNIEKIVYAEEEYDRKKLPDKYQTYLEASFKKKVKDSYTIYEAGKRDLYHPFDSKAIDEMIENEEGKEDNAAWFVNPMNFERENEFNPPEKWGPTDEMQRYPFMSKKDYDSQGYPDGAWWVKTLAFKETVAAKYKVTQYFPLEKLNLETWLKATKSKPRNWISAWDISDSDLGISEEDDLETYEAACYSYVEQRVKEWLNEYKHMKFPLLLYRALRVPSTKDINLKKLGIHWTTNEGSAHCYDEWKVKKPKESDYFLLKAKVLKTDIDWIGTLTVNINPHFGEDEQEVVLIPSKKIKVSIEDGKEQEGIV